MDYAVIISAIVLGLSVLATAAKFLDWFLHSDPKTMVRTIRWMLVLLMLVCVPLLVMMLVREQWAGAMLLGAGMLIVPTLLKWRTLLAPIAAAAHFRRKPAPFETPPAWEPSEEGTVDPRAVEHAARLLEAYVRQNMPVAAEMSVKEALEVLGLADGSDLGAVHAAHRRLMRMADPDEEGGSAYLAAKIDLARDVLVVALRRKSPPAAIEPTPRRLSKG